MNDKSIFSIYDNNKDKWFTCPYPFVMHPKSIVDGSQIGQFLQSNWFKQRLDPNQSLLCRVTRYSKQNKKSIFFTFSEHMIQMCITNKKKELQKINHKAILIFNLVSHTINKKKINYITLPIIKYIDG